MAKIRVYELARDLNMTNQALLDKIRNMNIYVKSHVSSLDEETVAKIKAGFNSTSTKSEGVAEIRVRPTIIRRRRIVVQEEPETKPETQEEEAIEEVEPEEQLPEPEIIKAADEVKKPDIEEKQEVMPQAKIEKKPVQQTAAPVKVFKKTKKEQPAKVLKLPDVEKKPEVLEESQPSQEVKPVEQIITKTIDTPAQVQPSEHAKKPVTHLKKTVEIVPEIPKKADPIEIIAKKEETVSEKKKGKVRDKREEDPDFKDKLLFKKKAPFKKKEIIEVEDLFTPEPRVRKEKKGAKAKAIQGHKTQLTVPKAIKRRIKIDDAIVLSDLAKRMGIKSSEMIKTLMGLGVLATVNQTIDFDTASLVATEFSYEVERASFEEGNFLKTEKVDLSALVSRPPVVTIMGHVDHGKTSLLDVIRKTKITEIEAGGITQHIGAYHVKTENGQIVFLDTPGHEAFTAMRARGAKVTDIVVLVVAADDGVKPQTVEAINHAKVAGVPIIVAINKMDKPEADPDRVKRELADQGLVPEEWGGTTPFLKVSAKQNTGIDDLLEMILLQAEVLELKANPNKLAVGHVVEAKLDSGRGPVATVLIYEGTLHLGESVVCGIHYGKVRALLDDRGMKIDEAGPSIPVEVIGFSGVPMAGDELIALADEKDAKQVSTYRVQKQRSKELAKTSRLNLENLFDRIQEGKIKNLVLIIKADVNGSIEAIRDSLNKLSNKEVKIDIIHSGTGTITESDVSLAAVSNAIIIGFNVRPSSKVQAMANEENVDIRYYNIIYNVIKDIKNAIVGLMASTFEEKFLGRAQVREVFHVPKFGAVAGSYVLDGKIERGQKIRLIRDGIVCFEGKNSSLRRFKDDVKEVQAGFECGIGIENYNDIKVDDIIEFYYIEEIKPELE
ncbi:translation initiation factor IF-2 [Desulfobacterium sp. N47]|uniref:Translation initiation factor IF-2 n=1 Tax=uncultured Desulfobacterium sp. TaxID=201089 RepID=E1YER2_9BACT|nr:Translation initiation factor IF-2 [uncultured Desulfobacterium sp.]